jgi:hypothetical protein
MKILFLSIVLLPLNVIAAQKSCELKVNNFSQELITVYYINQCTRYETIEPYKSLKIPLSSLPQEVTIHFNQLDRQHDITVTDTRLPLTICQLNKISIKQNGTSLVQETVFSPLRPTY